MKNSLVPLITPIQYFFVTARHIHMCHLSRELWIHISVVTLMHSVVGSQGIQDGEDAGRSVVLLLVLMLCRVEIISSHSTGP